MIQIFHVADLHLDAPFTALPPHLAAQRRQEQRELLHRLAEVARTGNADLVLLSGDLFDDGADTYAETTQALVRALGQVGCPVCIAPGNHDYYHAGSPYARLTWPENVTVFTDSDLGSVAFPQLNCTVYGCAFTAPHRNDSPLAGFTAPSGQGKSIGILHGDVSGGKGYGPLTTEEIAQSGLDYLALGHVHAGTGLQWAGPTPWAYPGCAEGRGFDELGEKGGLWVTLPDDGPATARFVPLALRRYELLQVPVTQDPLTDLLSLLPQDTQQDSYRIKFTGESQLEGLDLSALQAKLQDQFFSLTLQDATQIRRDLWERAGEDNLTGLFLQQIHAQLSTAQTPQETQALEKAVRFGLAALEHREEPLA